jgi:hypothetical protein
VCCGPASIPSGLQPVGSWITSGKVFAAAAAAVAIRAHAPTTALRRDRVMVSPSVGSHRATYRTTVDPKRILSV